MSGNNHLRKEREIQAARKQKDNTAQRHDGILIAGILVLIAGAILIFSNLSNRYLWEDEAETALLGRNILTYGIPKAFDGKNLISQELGRDYNKNYVWRWTPWLDKYIAALSFKILGEGTFQARVPFAFMGILSLISVYFLTRLIFKDPWMGVLSMVFLTLSIPFLLYVRQCRYYSIAILGSIWVLYFFFEMLQHKKRAVFGLFLAMTVLFHSNYLIFAGMTFSLITSFLIFYFNFKTLLRGLWSFVLIFFINMPWFIFFNILGKMGEAEKQSPVEANLLNYYSSINQFSFPWLAVLLFSLIAFLLRKRKNLLEAEPARPMLFLFVFIVSYVIFISFAPWYFFRYIVNLLPVFAILSACMCRALWSWNRVFGALFMATLLLTGIFHRSSTYPFNNPLYEQILDAEGSKTRTVLFPLGEYLYEITHDFDGPIEGIVKFLGKKAKPDDRVFISYGDLPLKFYTALDIKGGQTGEDLSSWPPPDWIIIRSFFRFSDRPAMKKDADQMRDYLNTRIPKPEYRLMEIPYVDIYWENIPEPLFHRFRTPKKGKRVQIWERSK